MVETHGFRGAAIDPFLAKIPANHAKYYPIYAKCCEFDIPVVISTGMATLVDGADPEHCHPRYIDAVARDFPKLKIVVSHGCYPWVNEIIMVVQRNRNVYLELPSTSSRRSPKLHSAANTMIGDKVIFASAIRSSISRGRSRCTGNCLSARRRLKTFFTTTPPSCLAFDGGQRAGSLVS